MGKNTPDPLLLWPGQPPRFTGNAPAETVTANAQWPKLLLRWLDTLPRKH
ncbi:MAG: hypothetical protein NTY53_09605 [Kiritimatiellaeota bacterium]|nr:hypothetical protein [Kiritimatiellota bacterium]